jgi:SCY1-like protein 1
VLTPLLSISKNLPEDEYQRRIVPCICKLFGSPDRLVRVKLLEKLDDILTHLNEKVVNEQIFKLVWMIVFFFCCFACVWDRTPT